ncbi:MAG: glutaredoxin family protein [Eubacteriaceae bacterium]|nr:glutaredoxin family protein [Eubacteriaceae bacterium]
MKKVIMYTTKTCGYCRQAKEFLSANRIHYIEKDLGNDVQAQNEMAKRSIRGVPAFIIGEDAVVGLDKEKILALVDHRLVECERCHTKLRVPSNQGTVKVTCLKCKNIFHWAPR